MTNPGNAVGTNGAYGGRTSVNAFNDVLSAFKTKGVMSGWKAVAKSGMTISVGGDGKARDMAIAEDDMGNRTTINNRAGTPVDITLAQAPTVGSRIDTIVAYVNNPPQNSDNNIDNPSACGIIAVKGNASTTPTAPTSSMIRTAITADGASGTTAYYVELATVQINTNVTTITNSVITNSPNRAVAPQKSLPLFATNLTVANDTPAGWAAALGGTGQYWIMYDQAGKFAGQPSQRGMLEVYVYSPSDVSQIWHNQWAGTMQTRSGSSTGWWNSATGSGWHEVFDSSTTNITKSNIDWSTITDGTNGFYKTQTYLLAGLRTDAGGFVTVPNNVVNPNTGIIIGATGSINAFYQPFCDTEANRYTLRMTTWDWKTIPSTIFPKITIWYALRRPQ